MASLKQNCVHAYFLSSTLTLPCFPNWHRRLQRLFRLACFFRCFRFRGEKLDVAVSIAGGKLFAASAPAPVKGEDLVVMHVHVGNGIRGTPLRADGRGFRINIYKPIPHAVSPTENLLYKVKVY